MPLKPRDKPMRTLCRLSLFMLALTATPVSANQSIQAMERIGFGVALVEQTRDVCYYAPEVFVTLDQLAARLSETAPVLWERVMKVSRANAKAMGNFARGINPDTNDCQAAAFGVSGALAYHVTMLGPNPIVLKEMERLASQGGRLATEDERSKGSRDTQTSDDIAAGQQVDSSPSSSRMIAGEWQFTSGEEDWGTMCFSSIKEGDVQVGFFASPGNDQITAYVDGVYQADVPTQWQVDGAKPHALNGSSDDYFGWHNFNDVPAQLLAEAASGRQLTITSDSGKLFVELSGSAGSLSSLKACYDPKKSSTKDLIGIPSEHNNYDIQKIKSAYNLLRGDCRIGDRVSQDESAAACEALNVIGDELKRSGLCWDQGEQEWGDCTPSQSSE